MKLIDGKTLSLKIKEQLKDKIKEQYLNKGVKPPTLAVVLVGNNPASEIYVKNKQKACEEVGILSRVIKLDENESLLGIKKQIELLNDDASVCGILVQLPLPNKDFETEVIETIIPNKDVDCLTYVNKGKLLSNNAQIAPCTPSGIIDIIKQLDVEIAGKNAVIIGRSQLVGRPVEILLNQLNATTTLCHSKTKNLKEITKQADILIVAIGRAKFINEEYVKSGAIVIDVGINRVENKVIGDVDAESLKNVDCFLTPVPGGVGPMTIAELLKNTLICANNHS